MRVLRMQNLKLLLLAKTLEPPRLQQLLATILRYALIQNKTSAAPSNHRIEEI